LDIVDEAFGHGQKELRAGMDAVEGVGAHSALFIGRGGEVRGRGRSNGGRCRCVSLKSSVSSGGRFEWGKGRR
jgi:hypothetical protein